MQNDIGYEAEGAAIWARVVRAREGCLRSDGTHDNIRHCRELADITMEYVVWLRACPDCSLWANAIQHVDAALLTIMARTLLWCADMQAGSR